MRGFVVKDYWWVDFWDAEAFCVLFLVSALIFPSIHDHCINSSYMKKEILLEMSDPREVWNMIFAAFVTIESKARLTLNGNQRKVKFNHSSSIVELSTEGINLVWFSTFLRLCNFSFESFWKLDDSNVNFQIAPEYTFVFWKRFFKPLNLCNVTPSNLKKEVTPYAFKKVPLNPKIPKFLWGYLGFWVDSCNLNFWHHFLKLFFEDRKIC